MKKVFAVSLDEETIFKLEAFILKQNYRNKSHLVETAIKRLLEEK